MFDSIRQKVGVYQTESGPYALLRPIGGGREWEADVSQLRPPTDRERLSAGLRAANERSARWSGTGAPQQLRRVFRYVPFTFPQDPATEPAYAARCVSGETSCCGAESGPCEHPAQVEDWLLLHAQETRHLWYQRTFTDWTVLERSEEVPGR
ncbi:DUF7848 domain-containing protein [Streptomyces sp. NPDC002454]